MKHEKGTYNYRPPEYKRDRARALNAPAPTAPALEAHLSALVSPATFALTSLYHRLGLRWRILNLPVMVALILTMVWRQVPCVSTLVRMLEREPLLWAPPHKVSQQALDQRLASLPAALFAEVFHALLPVLQERARQHRRPLPGVVGRALGHFARVWVVDATTLEELAHRVGLLRERTDKVLAGKVLAILDLPTKLPLQLWLEADAAANEKVFLGRIEERLAPGTLLLFDKGFYAFPFFDWLSERGIAFVTRARSLASYQVERVLVDGPGVHDRIIALGRYRSSPCRYPLRLVEVLVGDTWHHYLTNVLSPGVLPPADVADLYAHRWRIEEAFLLVKRLLGLAYIWNGSYNAISLQVWASWLLYAVLLDLCDSVAQALDLPLERISVEMVYRSLYFFCSDTRPDQPKEIVAYLAAQDDLGIVKRQRKRKDLTLDNPTFTLNL